MPAAVLALTGAAVATLSFGGHLTASQPGAATATTAPDDAVAIVDQSFAAHDGGELTFTLALQDPPGPDATAVVAAYPTVTDASRLGPLDAADEPSPNGPALSSVTLPLTGRQRHGRGDGHRRGGRRGGRTRGAGTRDLPRVDRRR